MKNTLNSNDMKHIRKSAVVAMNIFKYGVLIIGTAIVLFPVIYTILSSFKDTWEIYSSTSVLPKKWTLANYINVWKNTNVFRGLFNTLLLCITGIISSIVINSLTAYVLSRRMDMCLCRVLNKIYIASMFISLPVVTMYPTYRLMVDLGLSKSLLGLMVHYAAGSVSNILLIKGNLAGLGNELDEAAKIDGCSFWGIYWRIVLPLSKGIMATIAIILFRGIWNGYLFPLVMTMGQDNLKTLTVSVLELQTSGNFATDLGVSYAGASISIIPMIILFAFFSKYFTGNVTAGAIKG